jgi:hypothetical protein
MMTNIPKSTNKLGRALFFRFMESYTLATAPQFIRSVLLICSLATLATCVAIGKEAKQGTDHRSFRIGFDVGVLVHYSMSSKLHDCHSSN